MIAGFDKYFQIVRCFRDEDLRVDRQPEFTQIDVEMSFVKQDDIFDVIEGLIVTLWKEVLGVEIPRPFQRMPFYESMDKYGNDKPDLRFGMEHVVLTGLVKAARRRRRAAAQGGGGAEGDRQGHEGAGLGQPLAHRDRQARGVRQGDGLQGAGPRQGRRGRRVDPVALRQDHHPRAARSPSTPPARAEPGDLLLFQFGKESVVQTVMANLRLHLGKRLGLIPEYGSGGNWRFLWVVNPPLFEFDEESGQWAAAHHAFTRPHDECLQYLETDPGKVDCYRYDCVLNGFEIGGGSIRLHDPEVQARVFKAMGISDEEARSKFGFLLDALKMGAPPHGGIALGHGPAGDAAHRRRVAARRGGLAQDAEGDRPHDRRPRRRRREAAARPLREEHRRAAQVGGRRTPSAPSRTRPGAVHSRWSGGSWATTSSSSGAG